MAVPNLSIIVNMMERAGFDPKAVRFCRCLNELHDATIDLAIRDISAQVNPLVQQTRMAIYAGIMRGVAQKAKAPTKRRPKRTGVAQGKPPVADREAGGAGELAT